MITTRKLEDKTIYEGSFDLLCSFEKGKISCTMHDDKDEIDVTARRVEIEATTQIEIWEDSFLGPLHHIISFGLVGCEQKGDSLKCSGHWGDLIKYPVEE